MTFFAAMGGGIMIEGWLCSVEVRCRADRPMAWNVLTYAASDASVPDL